jgi:hypothetical protein
LRREQVFRERALADALRGARRTEVDVAAAVAFVDAALAVAGHEVTDPWSRELMERVARREITGDEAVAEIRRRFQG